MKTIPLHKAFNWLVASSAVIWDDNFLSYLSTSQLTDDPENEFLYLSATDEEGNEFSVKFKQGNNETVKVCGNSMFLVDDEGDTIQLTLLDPINVEDAVSS